MNLSQRYLINNNIVFNVWDNTLEFSGSRESIEPLLGSIVAYLIENADRPVNREELIEKFWGPTVKSDEALMKAISKIRKKFNVTVIKTINKVGYQWIAPVEVQPAKNKVFTLPTLTSKFLNMPAVVLIGLVLFIIKAILFPHPH
jgi:DNA-binding winged helix-turn-helix (wHTH) protein